jgi:hypothetical protein
MTARTHNLDTEILAGPRRSAFLERYLDPATTLGEVMFGLIMTLTFTLGAGIIIQDEGREGARQLLIAAIGCNIAWGVIDGALYLVGQLFNRSQRRRLAWTVRNTADERAASALIADELDPLLENVTTASERDSLYRHIANNLRTAEAKVEPLTRSDVLGAIASFWLVFLTSAPAAIPFLLIDEAHLALRVSNAVLLAILFVTGYWWARYTLDKPWIVGLSFLVGGTSLVLVAIALGG